MNFSYTPTDTTPGSSLKNCTLYVGTYGSSWSANRSNISVSSGTAYIENITFAQGFYTWNVRCFDHSGNSAFNATNRTFGVDSSAPGVTFTSPTSLENISSATPTLQFVFTDNVGINTGVNDTINITINVTGGGRATYRIGANSSEVSCDSSEERDTSVNCNLSSITLPQGDNNITIVVVDTSGNNVNTSSILFTVDNSSPVVSLDSPADDSWTPSETIRFDYTPTDATPGSSLKNCTLWHNASGTFAANETNISLTSGQQYNMTFNFPNGTLLWNIQCYDYSGNSAFNATNYTVKVDTTAPTISSSTTNNSVTSTRSVTFTVNDSASLGVVNLSSITVTLNNSATSSLNTSTHCTTSDGGRAYTCTYIETGMSGGWNVLNITARDNATNLASEYHLYLQTSGSDNFTLSLSSGWNFVSTPLILTNSTIENVVANNSNVKQIWYYNGTGWQEWASDGSVTTLSTLEPRKGYWINSTASTSLYLFGKYTQGIGESADSLSLSANTWYTIGHYKSEPSDGFNTSQVLTNLVSGSNYIFTSLSYWDATNQIPKSATQSTAVCNTAYGYCADGIWNRGRGFWIYMSAAGTYLGH
jgi:hypothetical protein